MIDWVTAYVERQAHATAAISSRDVACFIDILWMAFKSRRKIFVIGNGGSAANASHFAVDLGKGASDAMCKELGDRNLRFQVESLADNTPWLTALGNDYAYDEVFSQRLDNEGIFGDVLIGTSVSGTSPNLVKAFKKAGVMEMHRVALTRRSAAQLQTSIANECELHIGIDSEEYGICEDAEMSIFHAACYYFINNASELAKEISR